ncbi:hypothetical protein HYPSUDRAFT_49501 [Hypholoma sublateritium FD-334 SS-4]|uniref:Uncharacterized protein n=1 Tax=Hypholoma sublateritium (strain FD-334 SS-4) TaxID=945553 RepID=A0A0D2N417_HYPSF|nr:hypothetical protein HYPSUDRAFT_49501 [Hypholoma sublateritium FD-334 SS-4]
MAAQAKTEVVFSSSVRNMDEWAQITRIPLTTADALGATYARAHRWLVALKNSLVRDHRWTELPSQDPRILFSIEMASIWRSSVNLPAGPKLKLQLPVHASSFFSSERRIQWEMVFHSDTFESIRRICGPIQDILNLLQCLLTGVVTVALIDAADGSRTVRGLPPVAWINANEPYLVDIFGHSRFKDLHRAASHPRSSFKLDAIDA